MKSLRSAKRYRYLFVLVSALVIAITGLAALVYGQTAANTSDRQLLPPQEENIPVYPGARQVEVPANQRVDDARVTRFEASGNIGDVATFYRSVLSNDGWELYGGEKVPSHLAFFWSDPSKLAQWNLDLDMYLSEAYAKDGSHTSNIDLYLRRG